MNNEFAKSREFMLLWDSTKSNPNGDMLNDNRPRMDEFTGILETSDFRIKRFIRDNMDLNGIAILVIKITDEKGEVKTCAKRVEDIKNEQGIKTNEELIDYIMNNYLDAKLFGCVLTSLSKNFTGPIQIAWSRSVNKGVVDIRRGTTSYASKDNKKASTNWESYICEYALFKTYMVYNKNIAIKNGYLVTEEDLDTFKESLINGLKSYRSTSKNQMPRLLVEVIYKDNSLDGELDVLDIVSEVEDIELRDISQVEVDIKKLNKYYTSKKDKIEKVNIYKHSRVNLVNINKGLGFNIIPI